MAVPGVANVAIWGYRDKQIMVEAEALYESVPEKALSRLFRRF